MKMAAFQSGKYFIRSNSMIKGKSATKMTSNENKLAVYVANKILELFESI